MIQASKQRRVLAYRLRPQGSHAEIYILRSHIGTLEPAKILTRSKKSSHLLYTSALHHRRLIDALLSFISAQSLQLLLTYQIRCRVGITSWIRSVDDSLLIIGMEVYAGSPITSSSTLLKKPALNLFLSRRLTCVQPPPTTTSGSGNTPREWAGKSTAATANAIQPGVLPAAV